VTTRFTVIGPLASAKGLIRNVRTIDARRFIWGGVVAAAVLVGCHGSSGYSLTPSPNDVKAVQTPLNGGGYRVLYSFRGKHGASPYGNLSALNGTLYGTTSHGGTYDAGTFFEISASGKESVLRSFYGTRGALPLAGLINVNGRLYGTTELGGTGEGCSGDRCGTVFSITVSGKETVLHNFGRGADGSEPVTPLVVVKGTLYGTTAAGGVRGLGTVFAITPTGTETVLHSFGSAGDGFRPLAGLTDVNGVLYGTTALGGANSCAGSPPLGCGTVFSITTSGKETVIHSFSGDDGSDPWGGLVYIKDTLYGTTSLGGAHCAGSGGCGTVFAMTLSGKETLLHSFAGADGAQPDAGLTNVNGTLYGTTTVGGGGGSACDYPGCGTIFSITTSGKETVLHNFGNYGDGINPFQGLLNVKGSLYGMTPYGGLHGFGTVFTLKQ
jgi:uncharacterized repeat protein (TIGR03803 family)